jgi:hypothetical protein
VARTMRLMGAERSVFYSGSVGFVFPNQCNWQRNVNLTTRLTG